MRSLMLLLALSVAGCTRPATPAGADPLAAEMAGRIAGPAQACVSTIPNQNLRVIDSRTVAYDRGSELWVNRLAGDCPALSPFNTVIVEADGSQYCRGDRVRGLEPGGNIPGPTCNLQDWTPYRRP
jgi:hypothetical protein